MQIENNAREVLKAFYLEWCNNYLTTAKFAEHNGLTINQAECLLTLATQVFHSNHPEA